MSSFPLSEKNTSKQPNTLLVKIQNLHKTFSSLKTREALYQEIMRWGERLPPFDALWKTEENRVFGCQSTTYVHAHHEQESVFFYAHSDALISAGLAALLIAVYNGESPHTLLTLRPTFLEEVGIPAALTPGRANGLASLYLKMRSLALPKYIIE